MEEINHFSHEEHPLKLIENWETVFDVGDDDKDKKGVVDCYGCQQPISISGGSAYGCVTCDYFLHKTCAEATPTINHHFHPLHPLTLTHRNCEWNCNVCRKQGFERGFRYRCSECDFDACMKCGVAIALKEGLSMKLKYEGHHAQHTLTLQSRSATFSCDACHTKDEDFFYQCDDCDFWIHKSCTSLPPTINLPHHHHHHPLHLVYSLPDNFYNYKYFCEFCKSYILKNGIWLYHCANCRYFAHIKCALNAEHPSTTSDGPGTSSVGEEDQVKDLLQFPMSFAFTDPLKLLHSQYIPQENEINHSSHRHPLILINVDSQLGNNNIDFADPMEVCYGCVRPLSFPYYTCKHGCSFSLHKYCAHLPLTLQKHQLHPHHPLRLKDKKWYRCYACYSRGNTFVYQCETCDFCLDVNCAFLPKTIKHTSHNHTLTHVKDPKLVCNSCSRIVNVATCYSCEACKFHLCMYCAIRSPSELGHRYCKGHNILLTYPPVEDHPEDFYCDICEMEMHPKFPLYYCQNCKNCFHLYCLGPNDGFANIWSEGPRTEAYHKHPLTFVRRKKTPQYVCSKCNDDINGRLILECRAKTCNFNICFKCHCTLILSSSTCNND